MPILGQQVPTLLEISKQFGADGQPLPLAELLSQENEALDDIPFYEANSTAGHRISVETGLPTAVYRKLNAGILPSKGTATDVTESMGSLTSLGKVDKLLATLSGNIDVFRMRKNRRHMEAMNQTFMATLLYGDTNGQPESFLGIMPRYSRVAGAGAPDNVRNVIDAGGTGTDNMSILLVAWGAGSVYGIYPKGTQAGLQHVDYGEELAVAPDGVGELPMLRDWFEWNAGIAVEDWRNIVRIANIDSSDLTRNAATGADIIDLMVQADELIGVGGNKVWYMPGRVRTFLRRQMLNKTNVWVASEEIAGRRVTTFAGYPVRKIDRMTNAEARVI